MANLYCKIFVDTDISLPRLREQLIADLSLEERVRTLYGPNLEIDIRRNEDQRLGEFEPVWDNFIYSRFYLDVEPAVDTKRDAYVEAVKGLLETLWGYGADAIAACDFEEELPRKGGLLRD